MRPNLTARRSFHTETPCTISAKAAQRRDLSRREDVEPYRRSNNAKSEAGETGHKGRSKCAG